MVEMKTENNLSWLLEWYHNQCDEDWEHGNGIKIGTMDNPGWYLKININGTELENKQFEIVDINNSENDWVYCSIKDDLFQGFCGPLNLPEVIQIFCKWIEYK